jgi:hypothetical protein
MLTEHEEEHAGEIAAAFGVSVQREDEAQQASGK